MRIGVDASRAFTPRRTGPENFSYQLLCSLAKLDRRNQYFLYSPYPYPGSEKFPPNFHLRHLPFPFLWTKIRFSLTMLRDRDQLDLLLVPAHSSPYFGPAKKIICLHGLEYEFFPQAYSRFNRWYLRRTTKQSLKQAAKIITDSQNSKKDFIKIYQADPQKIEVISPGVNPFPTSKNHSFFKTPYFLFVGRLESRKNLVQLIKIFADLKKNLHLPHKLVLAGKKGFGFDKIIQAIAQRELRSEVILPGYIPDEKLARLYQHADIFFYPSLYEGFGFPPLEAMSAGIPVVAANSSSIPEIVGEAALLVDPNNSSEAVIAATNLIQDQSLRQNLIRRGRKRVKDFSWLKTAKKYLDLFAVVVGEA